MLRCDLYNLLRKISPRFVFYYRTDEYTHSSLWYKTECRCDSCEHGQFMVCGLPDDHVPEYTLFDIEDKIKLRGWREVLRFVHNKKHKGQYIIDRDRMMKILHKKGIWSLRPYTIKETFKTLGATSYERQK